MKICYCKHPATTREKASAAAASKNTLGLPRNSGRRRCAHCANAKNLEKRRAKLKARRRPRAKHRKMQSENARPQNQQNVCCAHRVRYSAAAAGAAARQTLRIPERRRAAPQNAASRSAPRGALRNAQQTRKPCSSQSAVRIFAKRKALQKHRSRNRHFEKVNPGLRFLRK